MIQQGNIAFLLMEAKCLLDLNEPQIGHALARTDDHILAVGGHTMGFIPYTTTEYYQKERWYLPSLYLHDTPFTLMLINGDVLVSSSYKMESLLRNGNSNKVM